MGLYIILQTDQFILEFDKAIKTLSGVLTERRPTPQAKALAQHELTDQEKKHAASLMRVNHVGEICAQALYQAQRVTSSSASTREQLARAAVEEEDHLHWCAKRIEELGSRPSLLNPVTEKQVEKHLDSHLSTLPENDLESRAIVEQMRIEEIEHGNMAKNAGAKELPEFIKKMMASTSKIMTKVAYHI